MMNTAQKPPVFKYLSADEFAHVSDYFSPLHFKKKSPIVKQGRHGKGIYIIKKGKALVSVRTVCDEKVILNELNPGSFFGETSLFAAQPSSASVFATTEMELDFLSNEIIQSLRVLEPLIGYKLIRAISEMTAFRIREKMQEIMRILKKISAHKARQFCAPLRLPEKKPHLKIRKIRTQLKSDNPILSLAFQDFTKKEIEILLSHTELFQAPEKTILFRSQKMDLACYFILSGVVQRVVEAGDRSSKLNICSPGGILGHVDFEVEEKRMITAIFREPSHFLRMGLNQRSLLEKNHPLLWARLHYTISQEIVEMLYLTNQLLLRLMREVEYV